MNRPDTVKVVTTVASAATIAVSVRQIIRIRRAREARLLEDIAVNTALDLEALRLATERSREKIRNVGPGTWPSLATWMTDWKTDIEFQKIALREEQ